MAGRLKCWRIALCLSIGLPLACWVEEIVKIAGWVENKKKGLCSALCNYYRLENDDGHILFLRYYYGYFSGFHRTLECIYWKPQTISHTYHTILFFYISVLTFRSSTNLRSSKSMRSLRVPWYQKPILHDAIVLDLQRGSLLTGFLSLVRIFIL